MQKEQQQPDQESGETTLVPVPAGRPGALSTISKSLPTGDSARQYRGK